MDFNNPEILGEIPACPDDDSGSVYEAPSEPDHASSDEADALSKAKVDSARGRGRKSRSRDSLQTATEIERSQSLRRPGTPLRRLKRTAYEPPNEARAKRLQPYYSNAYREALNVEIRDAATREIHEDVVKSELSDSQIGSSFWSSIEKEIFFSALSRLGRDGVLEISRRIGSKTELEVQDYIRVLHQASLNREDRRRNVLDFAGHPAALQLTEECCGIVERAGDALAIYQEVYEEQKESERWGKLWLLDYEINDRIDVLRRSTEGKAKVEDKIPSANFFQLNTWLELSSRIFMNPGYPHERDNWEALAEPGEEIGIRATALEDFHSLAVSITKRLISTTMFCTMSRQRAMDSKRGKHADINIDDVEAAVNILKLSRNTNEFWIGCARRCHLEVIDDDAGSESEEEDNVLSYEEVEAALGKERSDDSRRQYTSQGNFRKSVSGMDDIIVPEEQASESDNLSLHSSLSDLDIQYQDCDDEQRSRSSRFEKARQRRVEEKKSAERIQEINIADFDKEASRVEEARLWALLGQESPFHIKTEPRKISQGKFPAGEIAQWRDDVEAWSEWELFSRPVPEEEFVRNRATVSSTGRRKMREQALDREDVSSDGEDSDQLLLDEQIEESDEVDLDQEEDEEDGDDENEDEDRDEEDQYKDEDENDPSLHSASYPNNSGGYHDGASDRMDESENEVAIKTEYEDPDS